VFFKILLELNDTKQSKIHIATLYYAITFLFYDLGKLNIENMLSP